VGRERLGISFRELKAVDVGVRRKGPWIRCCGFGWPEGALVVRGWKGDGGGGEDYGEDG